MNSDEALDSAGLKHLTEVSKDDVVKQLFGDVGEIVDDFTCAVGTKLLIHGRMYITKRFICFYSCMFGLEKKIRIPYQHITAISKEMTALFIPNAIQITTESKVYLFRSFWDRDACFFTIECHLARIKGVELPKDPRAMELWDENIEEHRKLSVEADTEHLTASSATKSSEVEPPAVSKQGSDEFMDTESTYSGSAASNKSSIEDLASAFEQESQKSRLKISVVSDTLPISVADFYNLYVSETAPFGIKHYHETVKDTNLVLTPWAELSSSLGCGREMKFFKPVNLPGLACTRGVKIQRYRRFEDYALIVCSSTRLEDVPCADTFSVDDMIAVKALEDGSVGVSVEITFQVTFIKSTMMKYIIDRSTNVEMNKWLEVYFTHLKTTSQQFKEGKILALISSAVSTSDSNSNSNSNSNTTDGSPVHAVVLTTTETTTVETKKEIVTVTSPVQHRSRSVTVGTPSAANAGKTTPTAATATTPAHDTKSNTNNSAENKTVSSKASNNKNSANVTVIETSKEVETHQKKTTTVFAKDDEMGIDFSSVLLVLLLAVFVTVFFHNRAQWTALHADIDAMKSRMLLLEKFIDENLSK